LQAQIPGRPDPIHIGQSGPELWFSNGRAPRHTRLLPLDRAGRTAARLRSTFASHLRHGVAYTVIDVDVGTRNLPGFLGALSINWTVKNIVDRMCQPVCVKRGKVAPIANYLTVGTVRKVIKSKHERFVQCPLLGAKRTWLPDRKMSAYDPKRT
jgi:hypothetical protein